MIQKDKETVLVGLSGGVDSAVAACLLKEQGYHVIGATMSIWDKGRFVKGVTYKDACFSPHEEQDIEAAKKICEALDIPYHVVDCTAAYRQAVLENFKAEYVSGRTPNPCVMCNALIKFGALPRAAKEQGLAFDKFATGHYARIVYNESMGRYQLHRAKDAKKDQSYFLYRLTQEQLKNILFPLGELTKNEVRTLAKSYGLEVSDKPESQDFYAGSIDDLLDMPPKKGHFVSRDGKILGDHTGVWHFTLGQRKGLGISAPRPLYVIELRPETNEVVLGYVEEGLKSQIALNNMTWLSVPFERKDRDVYVKVRSTQTPVRAVFTPKNETEGMISFFEKQKNPAPGQSAVLYDEDGLVLGGGVIQKAP